MSLWKSLFGSPEPATAATPIPKAQSAGEPVQKGPWTPRTYAEARYPLAHALYALNTEASAKTHWLNEIAPIFNRVRSDEMRQSLRNSFWHFLRFNYIYAPPTPLASAPHDVSIMVLPAEDHTPPYATPVNATLGNHLARDQVPRIAAVPGAVKQLFLILLDHIPELTTFEDIPNCEYVPLFTVAADLPALAQALTNFIGGCAFNAYSPGQILFIHSYHVLAYNHLKIIGKTWREYEAAYVADGTERERTRTSLEQKAVAKFRSDFDRTFKHLDDLFEFNDNPIVVGDEFPSKIIGCTVAEAKERLRADKWSDEQMAGHAATKHLDIPSANFFIAPQFKIKRPADSKLAAKELCETYFQNTSLLEILMVPVPKAPVVIDPILRFSGTWIIANQGKGKTNLLRNLIRNRMNEQCSIIVFDSKPELSVQLRDLQFPKETVTIDPDPFLALNALDLGTHNVATLMYLFSGILDSKLTPLQSGLFQNTLHLCTLIPNATFTTFRDIISNGPAKYPSALAKLDEEDTEFWTKSFVGGTYRSTREEILWRLNTLRPSGSIFRTMFNAPKTLVKMQPLMDTNTLTIVNNSRAVIDPLQSEFFARLFLVMILGVAEQRAKIPESKRFPCYVVMDEAQTIIAREPLLSEVIHRMRAMKIALVTAHQSLSQLKDPLVESALDDCAIKYANNDHDAPALAQRFRTTTEHLQNLQIGEFAFWFQGQATASTYKAPWEDFSGFPKLTREAVAQRDAEMRRRYCYTPAAKPQGQIEPPEDGPTEPGTWGGKPVI